MELPLLAILAMGTFQQAFASPLTSEPALVERQSLGKFKLLCEECIKGHFTAALWEQCGLLILRVPPSRLHGVLAATVSALRVRLTAFFTWLPDTRLTFEDLWSTEILFLDFSSHSDLCNYLQLSSCVFHKPDIIAPYSSRAVENEGKSISNAT
ncbi:hypothetical protein B0T21DRAFT_349970 [Apiosordaria backusii]|uniref:Uncharacterized protein n=1 Tax=Apiosordaria backusii TaxID=314023 RepID=A0AA40B7T0_9PEZI|nr:hypothetical protein B0T21DRAFT_349970 [Apiosordaria backusii]